MKNFAITAAVVCCLTLFGCASIPHMPEIPQYHPANALAEEGYMEPSFKVLEIRPELPPNLPVPEGVQKPVKGGSMGSMGGKKSDDTKQGMKKESGEDWGDALDKPMHGKIDRPGMQEAMPQGGSGPEGVKGANPPEQQESHQQRIDENIKRGEDELPPVVVPSEQRGMNADSTLYHEHEGRYSTHQVQPHRVKQDVAVVGPRVWLCPRHPVVAVRTPGGRCPKCDTILVPVAVVEQPGEGVTYE